jgi:hypothetical protein
MRSPEDRGEDAGSLAHGSVADPAAIAPLTQRELAGVALLVIFATAVRLYGLGTRPLLWQDELGLLEYILTGDATWMPHEAPLYVRLQLAWMWWIQEPTADTMRLLSVAFGVLGVLATFVFGRLFGGFRVGMLAAILLSASPLALALAHEVRPYTLFILTTTSTLAFFVVAWERNEPMAWLGYGFSLAASLLTHLLAAQLCLALGITAVAAVRLERERPRIRAHFLAFAGTSLLFGLLGSAWVLSQKHRSEILAGPYGQGASTFVRHAVTSLGGALETQTPVALATSALAAVGLIVLIRRRPAHALLLASVIGLGATITYATMGAMSTWGWVHWQRYLSHLLVPYLVLVSIGTIQLAGAARRRMSGWPSSALAAAITIAPLLLVIPGALQWLESPNRHPRLDEIRRYATFVCERQHEVLGFIYTQGLTIKTPGISNLFTRQYYGFEQVRHDSLATYSLGLRGIQQVVKQPGRHDLGSVPEYVAPARPPEDGHYIVFPPGVSCDVLASRAFSGVSHSAVVLKGRWGTICDVRFERSTTTPSGRRGER